MHKIEQTLKENRVVQVLFSPKGAISTREYWFGIILLLMLSQASVSMTIASSFSFNINDTGSFDYAIIQSFINNTFYFWGQSFIPFTFIILYSSFVLTFKRCGGSTSTVWKCLLAVCSYLAITGIQGIGIIPMQYAQSAVPHYHVIVEETFNNSKIVLATLFGLGLLSMLIVALSPKRKRSEKESRFSSLNFVIYVLVYTHTLFPIFAFLLIRYMAKTCDYGEIAVYTIVVYLVPLLFLLAKRGEDAGIKPITPVGVAVAGFTILALLVYLLISVFPQALMVGMFIKTIIWITMSCLLIVYFYLIGLPSKESEQETSDS